MKKEKKVKDLTTGAILPHIIRMALPMILGLTAHMLLNIVDGVFVSRLGSNATRAVLNYAFPIFYIPFALFQGLSTGVSAILAQYLGAGKKEEGTNILNQMIYFSFALYVFFFLLYPLILPTYLKVLNVDAVTEELTRGYLLIVFIGLFFTSTTFMLGSALRAEGNMRTLSMAMVYGTLINLILDPFFIFDQFQFMGTGWHPKGLGLGVNGAAWATLISGILTFFMVTKFFLKKKAQLQWPKIPNWNNREGLNKILKVGSPTIISHLMMPTMMIGLTYLAGTISVEAVTAIGIGGRLDILAIFPALSITTAIIALVGQNYGAGKIDRVRETVKKGYLSGLIFLITVGSIVYLCRGGLVDFFKPTHPVENWESIRSSAMHYVACMTGAYCFVAFAMISGGTFQGLGRGLPGMFITVFRILVLNIGLGWVLLNFTDIGEYSIHYAPFIASTVMGTFAMLWVFKTLKHLQPK